MVSIRNNKNFGKTLIDTHDLKILDIIINLKKNGIAGISMTRLAKETGISRQNLIPHVSKLLEVNLICTAVRLPGEKEVMLMSPETFYSPDLVQKIKDFVSLLHTIDYTLDKKLPSPRTYQKKAMRK